MKLQNLKTNIKMPVFSRTDVLKLFPEEPVNQINTQLYRMIKRGDLIGLKRGLYIFPNLNIDEFVIANKLYKPSYVSLESALNVFGVIPDIYSVVTSVTTVTSKKINTSLGNFKYSKINENLFFGYKSILDERSGFYYSIANPEKALLDLIYIRKVKNLSEYRVDLNNINQTELLNYSQHFPKWVRDVIKNA
jgi:predicted transcriptional regulator of viral defense system